MTRGNVLPELIVENNSEITEHCCRTSDGSERTKDILAQRARGGDRPAPLLYAQCHVTDDYASSSFVVYPGKLPARWSSA